MKLCFISLWPYHGLYLWLCNSKKTMIAKLHINRLSFWQPHRCANLQHGVCYPTEHTQGLHWSYWMLPTSGHPGHWQSLMLVQRQKSLANATFSQQLMVQSTSKNHEISLTHKGPSTHIIDVVSLMKMMKHHNQCWKELRCILSYQMLTVDTSSRTTKHVWILW